MRAMKRKRPALASRFLLHQDNAPSHRSLTTQSTLAELNIETLEHPAYSRDLAPCDFYLFPTIKSELRGKRFNDVGELPTALRETVRKIQPKAYRDCYKTLVTRWQKCVDHRGEYFEKE